MKLSEITNTRQIVLVCGNLSSGKGHFIKQHYANYEHLSVSSIVKTLTNATTRSELGSTAHLDKGILGVLIERIKHFDKIVVDGIRQLSILRGLEDEFRDQIKDIIWLEVPMNKLRARFEMRQAKKDDLPFDQAIKSDQELGIGDVERYIKRNHKVIPY